MAKTAPRTQGQAETLTETDLANRRMGDNKLQADDQESVRNERHAVPGVKDEADSGPVESFRRMDKDVRAEEELGKGNRAAKEDKK